MNTDWMIANVDRYDNFLSSDPKVFLGEYASWGNQWENGLAEAAFMTGLEKNVHAVGLACYAPMFANVDYVNWRPDMIWFDNNQVYGSDSAPFGRTKNPRKRKDYKRSNSCVSQRGTGCVL